MKKIIVLLFIGFLATNAKAQEIKWMTMNEALAAQKETPKKIFMDAYTTWCGPCKMLDRNTFSNKDVANYINEHYYPVKFNAEGPEKINFEGKVFKNPGYDPDKKGRNSTHSFASAMQLRGYPSLVFFDEEGKLIAPLVGYRTPQQLEIYLKMFAQNDYKELTTQGAFNEYKENFVSEF